MNVFIGSLVPGGVSWGWQRMRAASAKLTFPNCIDMTALSEDEADAIAKHQRIPALIALELGNRLLETRAGAERLREFTADNLLRAQDRSDCAACAKFARVPGHYLEAHRGCREEDGDRARRLVGMIAIGLVERVRETGEELPGDARAAGAGIEPAIRLEDCPACGEACLGRLEALDGRRWPGRRRG